jgi:prolyl 4-hydroxylase
MDEIRDSQLRAAARAGDATAQFRLGMAYLQREKPSRAMRWLRDSAASGHAPAALTIGRLHMSGAIAAPDPAAALTAFESAAANGSVQGQYEVARLKCCGWGVGFAPAEGMTSLLAAARGGHVEALRVAGVILGQSEKEDIRDSLATACLQHAAAAGDAIAAHLAGLRVLAGRGTQPDTGAATALFAIASRQFEVSRRIAGGLGLDVGAVAGSAGATDTHLDLADLADTTWPDPPIPDPEPLHESPRIARFNDLLDRELCDYIRLRAEPDLLRSNTIDPRRGTAIAVDLRTSSETNFLRTLRDPATGWIERRLAKAAGVPLENTEPLAVLRYLPGEEYKPHYDFVQLENQAPALRALGQRLHTMIVYLDTVAAGGETAFPRLGDGGLTFAAAEGNALFFDNCDESGEPDPRSLHAGMPVEAGEKWVATLWCRANRVPMR